MTNEPRIEHRPSRPYLGIATTTSMQKEADAVTSHLHRLRAWMAARDVQGAGAPFVRYRRIDMPHRLEIEACVPVAETTAGDGDVLADELPAGRYAVVEHTGPLDGLIAANAALQEWARECRLDFDVEQQGSVSAWTARIEVSLSDPAAEPDPRRLQTEIAYLLR